MSFKAQAIFLLKGDLGTIQSVLVVFTGRDNLFGLFEVILACLKTLQATGPCAGLDELRKFSMQLVNLLPGN